MIGKQLTPNSWLLTLDIGSHAALAFKRGDVFVSTHTSEKAFETLDDIAKDFGEKFTEKKKKKEALKEILNFPIKHEEAFDIEEQPYPSYKLKENSNVRYAVGWWVCNFDSGVRVGISPKVSTLDENSKGPFKTKFDATVISGLSNG